MRVLKDATGELRAAMDVALTEFDSEPTTNDEVVVDVRGSQLLSRPDHDDAAALIDDVVFSREEEHLQVNTREYIRGEGGRLRSHAPAPLPSTPQPQGARARPNRISSCRREKMTNEKLICLSATMQASEAVTDAGGDVEMEEEEEEALGSGGDEDEDDADENLNEIAGDTEV